MVLSLAEARLAGNLGARRKERNMKLTVDITDLSSKTLKLLIFYSNGRSYSHTNRDEAYFVFI